ncbi:kinase-like domain-containing protein [Gigaspora rosea]|uniref:Kinase-like domain-containing protein n=1 Tax=Gigaspora rosea TaxID=44941 RepID=A0A397W1W3_9GLOM|nr:kinase-like domain-containing protein [Gigaspora rosea]
MPDNTDDNSIEEIIKTSGIEFYDFNEFSEFNKIGEGGFGQIERAYWKKRKITVALKSLKVKMNSNENVNEGFKREARLLANISKDSEQHPNVNQFYGVTKTKDENLRYFLILEYTNGGNLREYLKKHFAELTWGKKLNMAFEIASGLKYLHINKNIIHRDLVRIFFFFLQHLTNCKLWRGN